MHKLRASSVALLTFAAMALAGCSAKKPTLIVTVVTSLVAGPEFTDVDVALLQPGGPLDSAHVIDDVDTPATLGQNFAHGRAVASFTDLTAGEKVVRVQLKRPDGTLLIQRRVAFVMASNYSLTVYLTRDCVGVMCPSPGGSAALTECLSAQCVDPRCDPSDATTRAMYCPAVTFCNDATECSPVSSCAEETCSTGVCIPEAVTPAMCTSDSYCDPTHGCKPTTANVDAGTDAGADAGIDASATDAATMDATMMDSSVPDSATDDLGTADLGTADLGTADLGTPDMGIDMTVLVSCAVNNGGCDVNANCTGSPGATSCRCKSGFFGDGTTCTDIDECTGLSRVGPCDPAATCTNLPGSFMCTCNDGYMGDGTTCVDINECAVNMGGCDPLAGCTNVVGTFECNSCPSGYSGNGLTGCHDINECDVSNGGCEQLCTNTVGSFTCSCNIGNLLCGGSCAACPTSNVATTTCSGRACVAATCATGYVISNGTCQPFEQNAYVKPATAIDGRQFGSAVAISGDGNTLVVGAAGDSSDATGINGNQTNVHAPGSGAVYVFARASGAWTQQAYIKALTVHGGDLFGSSVSVSADGNTIVAGAPGESSASTGVNSDATDTSAQYAGAAYVFTRTAGMWTQIAYVKPQVMNAGSQFGTSVAMSADGAALAVGAYREQSAATGVGGDATDTSLSAVGAAYVFRLGMNGWAEEAYVKPSTSRFSQYFGYSVALSGDGTALAVGAFGESSNATGINGNEANASMARAGAAYVYRLSAGTWAQEAYVKASNSASISDFGYSVSLSSTGHTLAVGARFEASNATGINGNQANIDLLGAGAAYVYEFAASTWSQEAYIKASNTNETPSGAFFGYSVSLSSDGASLIVGATGESSQSPGINGNQSNASAVGSGAAYVFTRASSTWSQLAYVKASNPQANVQFGGAVSMSSDGSAFAAAAQFESSRATGINSSPSGSGTNLGAVYTYSNP